MTNRSQLFLKAFLPMIISGLWSCNSDDEVPLDRANIAREYISVLGFDDLSALDLTPWLDKLKEDVIMNDPYGHPAIPIRTGKEAVKAFGQQFSGFYESNRFQSDEIFVAGRCAVVKFTWSGILNDGQHTPFSNEGIDVLHIENDGLISLVEGYWESPSLGPPNPHIAEAGRTYLALASGDYADFDFQAWEDQFAENVAITHLQDGQEYKGKDETHAVIQSFASTYASLQFEVEKQYTSGDRTSLLWEATGTTLAGVGSSFRGVVIVEVDTANLEINKVFGYWN